MYISSEQSDTILKHSQNLEKRTGVEILAAVVGKCDTYPEIPWRAFALGSALSGLLVAAKTVFLPHETLEGFMLIPLLSVLGAGALAAVLTPFWPAFARLFLDRERAAAEAQQYAQGLFLEQELFRTDQRKALLLLIGVFEHQVVILPDTGVADHLSPDLLKDTIDQMTPQLREGDYFQAVVLGITLLEEILVQAGFEGSPDKLNQIPDDLIQEKGGS